MKLSNLFLNSPVGTTNSLLLANAGFATPLEVGDTFELRNHGEVIIDHSSLFIRGLPGISAFSIGTFGSGNRLTITNGGLVVSREATIGNNGTSNLVLVTGAGSRWINTNGSFSVANNSPGVGLIVSNGGSLLTKNSGIGNGGSADGNLVIVTDPGSVAPMTA